jgi:hypothetical protein
MLSADDLSFLKSYEGALDTIEKLRADIGNLRDEFQSMGKDSLIPNDALNVLGKTLHDFRTNLESVQKQAKAFHEAPEAIKDYSSKINAVFEKLNKIPEGERNQYSNRFGELQKDINVAS